MTKSRSRAELERLDDAHVWHPFTPHSVYRDEDPLLVAGGEGNYLIDVDGNRYLDGVASIWCNAFGHRRPEIDSAVQAQLGKIAHSTLLGNASVPSILLAEQLVKVAPKGLDKVFYSDSGSTAVEVALKMALQFWQQSDRDAPTKRCRFLALEQAYNGDTVGAVSVGGINLFHSRFAPMLFEVARAPSPHSYRHDGFPDRRSAEAAKTQAFEKIFLENAEELAAVVVEPGFQGAGGILPLPPGYLQRVAELCRAHDVLLIFDEVAVGMGRSGRMFAAEREGVTPDFLCVAKGITGGYLPLAATLTSNRIFEAFLGSPEEGRTFFHGHTYTGNALASAAALATLEIFERERVIDTLGSKIDRLRGALESLGGMAGVGDVRQYGLAAGIELVADRAAKTAFPAAQRRGFRVCRRAREKGVFLRPLGDVIVIMPPLSVTLEEIDLIVDAIKHGIEMEVADAS